MLYSLQSVSDPWLIASKCDRFATQNAIAFCHDTNNPLQTACSILLNHEPQRDPASLEEAST
jgi:hypothetical protein